MASKLDIEDGVRGKHRETQRRGIVGLQNNMFRVRVMKILRQSRERFRDILKGEWVRWPKIILRHKLGR